MRRPGYREAIEWVAGNDDCYWLGDDEPIISVCASMVRDIFDVAEEKLFKDLRAALARVHPGHAALRKELPPAES